MVTGTVYKCPKCGRPASGCVLDQPCQQCESKAPGYDPDLGGIDIKKFLDENADLFRSLAQNIMCAKCRKIVEPPFYNLGVQYDSFEGCKKCWEEINQSVG